MNIQPIILTKDNFKSVIYDYFPVEQNEDIRVLLHTYDEYIDDYLKQRLNSFDSLVQNKKYKSIKNTLKDTLSFFGEDLNLVPYLNLKENGTFEINYNSQCSEEDIELLIGSILEKLKNQNQILTEKVDKLFKKLNMILPANFFSYESNREYLSKIYDYIEKCRFTNLDSYFKMAEPIFSIQHEIYEIFKQKRYLLISGGTGVGKTSVIPILYYHFLKSQNQKRDDYSMYICEPRISTAKNPYQFLRLNTGSDFKFSFNEIDKLFEKRYEIDEKLIVRENEYIERVYHGFQYIQIAYRGHSYRFKKTKITFMTDGIFYARLVHNPNKIFELSLIVIDEVHENSLNSLIGLAILAAYREEFKDDSRYDIPVILMTAMCQQSEKRIFNNLLPGLYEFDKLPSVTKFKVTEVARPKGDEIEDCVNIHENGLIFVPNEMAIDSYIQKLSEKFKSLLCVKLTRNTNIHTYNGDVTRYLTTYAINRNRNYLVVATNVAESSITFPYLNYVIDLGKQVNVNYDIYTRSYKVETDYMTLNSKIQRIGRVGRNQDGKYIRLYQQSDLKEYKNRIRSENLTSYLIDIICNFKSETLRKGIIEKIRNSFECLEVIDQYIKEFMQANLIDNTITYTPSQNLLNIYYLKQNLRTKYNKKVHIIPEISIDQNEENEDEETAIAENNDAEMKILTMLYYCNIEQIRKLLVLLYEGKLIDVLRSSDYKKYTEINKHIALKSDLILLLKYLQSYPVNTLNIFNEIIQNINNASVANEVNVIPKYGNGLFDDIDMRVFSAIKKSLHFDITFSSSKSSYSSVKNFNSAYFLEIDKSCTLLHSTSYVRDFEFAKI